jgi:Holliday junction resolvasome RuvABC endonuclease subunit
VKIIALDMGRLMGVAIGHAQGAPSCHTEILGDVGGQQSSKFCQLLRVINKLITDHQPDALVIEQPIAGGVAGKAARVEQAFGYRGCIFGVAHMRKVKTAEYKVQEIRKHIIGTGTMKSALAKPAVFDRCQSYGWTVADFEQSDAAAVWHLARFRLYGIAGPDDLLGREVRR